MIHLRLVSLLFLVQMLPRTISDLDDELCLTSLTESLKDPKQSLRNWTKESFANPCKGFSSVLNGAVCNNGRIFKLNLSNMALEGTIAPSISKCTNLQTLDLSSNSISGSIPTELQSLLNLAVLNLSNNKLDGEIPPQLASCAYLNVIDLHGNRLSGQIPQQLMSLVRLSTFDVSYNRLSGPIPTSLSNRTGNNRNFVASSFVGNKGLYGYPLPPMKSKGLSVLTIVGIGVGSGLASLVLSFAGVCVWLRFSEQKTVREEGKINHLMPDY